jgi:hypothetical protein
MKSTTNTSEHLKAALLNLINTWLVDSRGIDIYCEKRVKFDDAVKPELLNSLKISGIDLYPIANSPYLSSSNGKIVVIVKTLNTNFKYYPCVNYESVEKEKIYGIDLEEEVRDLLKWMSQVGNHVIDESYVLFIVFPTTHNDKSWEPQYIEIEKYIEGKLDHYDFRFLNNAPGTAYFGKIDISENGIKKFEDLVINHYKKLSLPYSIKKEDVITRVKLKTGTYLEILNSIRKDLLIKKAEITVSELQEIFENKVKNKLIEENEDITAHELESYLKVFDSKGTGAKKAQILLTTVNEKNRIHYRNTINPDSEFNLFVYTDEKPEEIKFLKRKIKAFSLEDSTISDKIIMYSLKKKELSSISVEELKNKLPNYNQKIKIIKMPSKKEKNRGIIVRVDWNEFKWEKPTNNIDQLNFGYAIENNISHTAFNFAHEIYPCSSDGYWQGLIPALHSKTPNKEDINNIEIVFLVSNFEHNDYLIGLYAFPKFGKGKRKILIPNFENYDLVNIAALPENILRLESYIDINVMNQRRALGEKEISNQGFTYLNSSNIGYILDKITELNPSTKLSSIKLKVLKKL